MAVVDPGTSAAATEVGRAEGQEGETPLVWKVRGATLPLDAPAVMGILNRTPDSFSDGGEVVTVGDAIDRAATLVRDGATLLDVGGESTRPGATVVPVDEELDRVVPVVEALASRFDVPLSVDTRKAAVARAALERGARIVNDVSALSYDPELATVVAESGAGLVLMHMRGVPETMGEHATYDDVAGEVVEELGRSLRDAAGAGIDRERVVVDPGIGFAKTAGQSLTLLRDLERLRDLGRPILVGPSRKSFLGALLDVPADRRDVATAAVCALAQERGARIFRVHDARSTVEALRVARALSRSRAG